MAFVADKGVTPKGEKYDRRALIKDALGKKYKRTQKGDFIYSSNNLESGSIGLNRFGDACISPVYSIFKPRNGVDSIFIGALLTQKNFISEMTKYRQGVVYGQWKIPEREFLKIKVLVPSFEEQKKIAECLEAEDKMIAAQQQKVESLKAHKKGLMQQLFPNPGTTIPHLRFPGFEGEWKEKRLGEILRLAKGKQVNGSQLNKTVGFPMMNGGATLSGYYSSYNCESDTIIISEGGNSCGFVNYMKERFWAGGHCYIVSPINKEDNSYLFHALKYNENNIMALRVGSGLPNIQSKNLLEFIITVPPTAIEQQKIAECLSSLDQVISAEEKELESLKTHKKGLLQQLFPQPVK